MRNVTLKSNDGYSFDVSVNVAAMSKTLETQLKPQIDVEDDDAKETHTSITLSMVSGIILNTIVIWCDYHQNDPVAETRRNVESQVNVEEVKKKEEIPKGKKRSTLRSYRKPKAPVGSGDKAASSSQDTEFEAFTKMLRIERRMCDWDRRLVEKEDVRFLCELGKAAAYLQIKGLVELAANAIQQKLIDQYPPEELFKAWVVMSNQQSSTRIFSADGATAHAGPTHGVIWHEDRPSSSAGHDTKFRNLVLEAQQIPG
ncbi:SKP1-like protein 19 isoform X2 [Copidosoma floridanum]|nr:SKP1-like protein 19 isoform X2 [Copidosoma floridanum]XP_014219404.1 SKP1-like protein 19 isoform X2 [Copidosoma floridanum]